MSATIYIQSKGGGKGRMLSFILKEGHDPKIVKKYDSIRTESSIIKEI